LVDIVNVITDIRRLGTEEEHEDELGDDKDLKDVEDPGPAEVGGDLAADDGGEGRGRVEDEGDDGDAETTLVDKEGVAYSSDDQGLEGGGGESLDDTGGEKGLVVLCGLADGGSDDHHQGAEKEDGTLAPFAGESADEGTGAAGSEKVVASEDGDVGDGDVEFCGDDDDGRVEQRAVRGSVEHGAKQQDQGIDFLPPLGPVERIVGVLRGLRREDDVRIAAAAVLESDGDIGVCGLVVEQHRAGNVRKLVIFEDSETHDG